MSEFPFADFDGLAVVNGGRALYFGAYDVETTVGSMFAIAGAEQVVVADGVSIGDIVLNSPQRHGVVAVSLQP